MSSRQPITTVRRTPIVSAKLLFDVATGVVANPDLAALSAVVPDPDDAPTVLLTLPPTEGAPGAGGPVDAPLPRFSVFGSPIRERYASMVLRCQTAVLPDCEGVDDAPPAKREFRATPVMGRKRASNPWILLQQPVGDNFSERLSLWRSVDDWLMLAPHDSGLVFERNDAEMEGGPVSKRSKRAAAAAASPGAPPSDNLTAPAARQATSVADVLPSCRRVAVQRASTEASEADVLREVVRMLPAFRSVSTMNPTAQKQWLSQVRSAVRSAMAQLGVTTTTASSFASEGDAAAVPLTMRFPNPS